MWHTKFAWKKWRRFGVILMYTKYFKKWNCIHTHCWCGSWICVEYYINVFACECCLKCLCRVKKTDSQHQHWSEQMKISSSVSHQRSQRANVVVNAYKCLCYIHTYIGVNVCASQMHWRQRSRALNVDVKQTMIFLFVHSNAGAVNRFFSLYTDNANTFI